MTLLYFKDLDFSDAQDSAGGQFSSLADLGRFLTSLLSPTRNGSLLPPATVNEWTNPVFSWTESQGRSTSPRTIEYVGAPWEIRLLEGGESVYSKGELATLLKQVKILLIGNDKGGSLPGYWSDSGLVPDLSLGIVVLRSGTNSDTINVLLDIFSIIRQPFVDTQRALLRQYVGTWVNGMDVVEVAVYPDSEGSAPKVLVVKGLEVDGVDVLTLGTDPSAPPQPAHPETRHNVAL